MRTFVLIPTLLSAFTTALPATTSGDGRGATIWTEQCYEGSTTAIPPAHNWCTDLNNIFGKFDGKVRSIKVEPGYKCQFYTSYGCPSTGKKLELGGTGGVVGLRELDPEYDLKIHSAWCAEI